MDLIGFEIRRFIGANFHCLECVTALAYERGWVYKSKGARQPAYAVVRDHVGIPWRVGAGGTINPNKMATLDLGNRQAESEIGIIAIQNGLRLPLSRRASFPVTLACHRCGRSGSELPVRTV
jgi:hypothetical protein